MLSACAIPHTHTITSSLFWIVCAIHKIPIQVNSAIIPLPSPGRGEQRKPRVLHGTLKRWMLVIVCETTVGFNRVLCARVPGRLVEVLSQSHLHRSIMPGSCGAGAITVSLETQENTCPPRSSGSHQPSSPLSGVARSSTIEPHKLWKQHFRTRLVTINRNEGSKTSGTVSF